MPDVVHRISRRVIRTLRQLGYLESGIDEPVTTGYDPLVDDEPELAVYRKFKRYFATGPSGVHPEDARGPSSPMRKNLGALCGGERMLVMGTGPGASLSRRALSPPGR